jgi:hypothetical protein
MSGVAACASPYAQGGITGGFEQRQLADGVWRVSYNANAYTSEETVQTYWLYRCAELTIEQGYDGFQILSNVQLTEGESEADGASLTRVVQSGLDGKPYMVADIRLLRTPLPDRPRVVFDAVTLRAFLAPYVTGEMCGSNVCPHVHRYLFPDFRRTGQDTPA